MAMRGTQAKHEAEWERDQRQMGRADARSGRGDRGYSDQFYQRGLREGAKTPGRMPFYPAGWASHTAQGTPVAYPGPDGTTQYFEGYPKHWFEVHEHRNLTTGATVRHSHADTMTVHDGHGPAALDTCAQCWRHKTGLKGGGQKRFTAKPNGEQL